ncbi:hypothetical protein CTEN210_12892 [Chaetoceros tenuissimus]|uniref:Uncharacterized protein n=1 Tax=Chaetoceros tenuissimus TaxID=426638 RepID=A0AAD3HAQ2_9STRA|nr:hypothetical protein CTEN210_12892 [Chaetoceros tenuissimus]
MGCTQSSGPKYEDYDWVELPANAKKAAETMGYNKKKWDGDKGVEYDDYDWEELPEEVKKAAMVLGYDETTWDKE